MDRQRGRKGQKIQLVPIERPEPPADMPEEQAEVWRTTVNRLPEDWFPAETHPLLAQYCRHVVSARRLGERVEHAEQSHVEPKELALLLKMHEAEGRALSSLATRMRLSQQATYDATKTKGGKVSGGRKPWESRDAG